MSKYLDDDDFYDEENDIEDYDQGDEFIEEELPQEEFDQLYALLPEIKEYFSQYNNGEITDDLLKKTLWLNYFNLSDSIKEIKSNYKKIPTIISFTPTCLLVGGSSKLALLLQKRLQKRLQQQQEEENNQREQQEHQEVENVTAEEGMKNKLISILDKLSSKPLTSVPRTKLVKTKPVVTLPIVSTLLPSSSRVVVEHSQPKTEIAITVPTKPEMEFPSKIELDSSLLITCQTKVTKLITVSERKRKLDHLEILNPIYTNDSILVKKISTNFNKPSPDDIVLQAQANLFKDVNQNLQKISINEKESTSLPQPLKKLKKNEKFDLSKELSKIKPQLSFVIFGHVDSGKSTIIGRMLYDLKIVDSKTLHKLQQESDKIGKGSFALAWIMDQTDEERSRGVTVDIVNTLIETPTAKFNIIDSPGHQDFVPQLINGIAQADVGVLIIDCNDYENGFQHIKEQVLISKNLGIDDLIVALNKFDLLQYDLTKLDHIIENLTENLIKIGYLELNLRFVPVSGLIGDNITKPSSNFQWLNSLLDLFQDLLDSKQEQTMAVANEPFIMTINEVLEISAKEIKASGRVNAGFATNGDEFETLPDVSMVKLDQTQLQQKLLIRGEFFDQLKFRFINNTGSNFELITNGDLITNDVQNFQTTSSLNVDLRLFEMAKPLLIGASFVLFHNCKLYPSRIVKINSSYNKKNEEVSYKKRHLVSLQRAKVVIELDKPLSFNLKIDKLQRIVVRRDGLIIGCGEILTTV